MGVFGQWVHNLHESKRWPPPAMGLSQVTLGWRNPKGSGLGDRGACVISPHPPRDARAPTPRVGVKPGSLCAQPLVRGTPKCPSGDLGLLSRRQA